MHARHAGPSRQSRPACPEDARRNWRHCRTSATPPRVGAVISHRMYRRPGSRSMQSVRLNCVTGDACHPQATDQKSQQIPPFSQSPYLTGSGPFRPPISLGRGCSASLAAAALRRSSASARARSAASESFRGCSAWRGAWSPGALSSRPVADFATVASCWLVVLMFSLSRCKFASAAAHTIIRGARVSVWRPTAAPLASRPSCQARRQGWRQDPKRCPSMCSRPVCCWPH